MDLVLPGRRGALPIMVLPVQDLRGREIKQLSIVTLRANDGVGPGLIIITTTLYYFSALVISPSSSSLSIHF